MEVQIAIQYNKTRVRIWNHDIQSLQNIVDCSQSL
jgi:hypothetical protein